MKTSGSGRKGLHETFDRGGRDCAKGAFASGMDHGRASRHGIEEEYRDTIGHPDSDGPPVRPGHQAIGLDLDAGRVGRLDYVRTVNLPDTRDPGRIDAACSAQVSNTLQAEGQRAVAVGFIRHGRQAKAKGLEFAEPDHTAYRLA